MIKWPPSSAKFEIAPRALIRGFTGFRFLPQLQKRNKLQQRNKFHRQVPSVACPGPQCKRGLKGRIMNRFTKEDKELS